MRIRTVMALSAIVLMTITGATALVLFWTYDNVRQARVGERYSGQIILAAFELNALATEYLAEPAEAPRRQWENRHQLLADIAETLPEAIRQSGPDMQRLQSDVEQLGALFSRLTSAERAGDDGAVLSELETLAHNRLVADMGRISRTVVTTATLILRDARLAEEVAERRAITVLIIFTGIVIGLLAILWIVIARRVLGRIGLLQQGIKAVEAGKLDVRIGLSTNDEIGEVAGSFDSMAAELERSHKELAQFAYVASHDLQEPLRMVASYTELLAQRYHGAIDEQADKYIGYAVEGSKRMQTLIDDLLAYSRVGTRGRPFEPTDCGAVVDEAVGNLQRSIDESGARVIRSALPTLLADRIQLVQLFQNLIGNAIRYRSEKRPRIEIDARRIGLAWTFSVRDNGIGIDPQFVDRIFVIFQRLQARNQTDGNGIGLAIVKRIVERHGGQVWVESEPGSGSTFLFTLGRPEHGGQTA